MFTYLCKYSPTELMAGFGVSMEAPNSEEEDLSFSDTIIHPNLCSHAKMLVTRICGDKESSDSECKFCFDNKERGKREILLTNCCDSIRRVFDSIDSDKFGYACLLDLPHVKTTRSAKLYASELKRLADEYEAYSGIIWDKNKFLAAWKKSAKTSEEFFAKSNKGRPFCAVMGARVPDNLLVRIKDGLDVPVCDLTCGGIRTMPPIPEAIDEMSEDELFTAYAEALLSQVPCTRMKDIAGRDSLIFGEKLSGIVYHTIRFCDYYSFEFTELFKKTDIPILKIESDYTNQSTGQLSTRIAAFNETLNDACGVNEDKMHKPELEDKIFVGIDSGSTTTNAAAIDIDGNIIASSIIRTGPKAGLAAEQVMSLIRESLGDKSDKITRVISTGYGRDNIDFADDTKTEISCHAKGAHHMAPSARTIIDIGGQDSKVISLDDDGNVKNFIMNDKCAAGTGRFLEMMCSVLDLTLDEMAVVGLDWKKDLTISSTCTVFAESEVVSLIAENSETSDIVHALNKAVAGKTFSMIKRVGGTGPYIMTGGVAKNLGLVNELKARIGEEIEVGEHPDLAGAVGAALFAMESLLGK